MGWNSECPLDRRPFIGWGVNYALTEILHRVLEQEGAAEKEGSILSPACDSHAVEVKAIAASSPAHHCGQASEFDERIAVGFEEGESEEVAKGIIDYLCQTVDVGCDLSIDMCGHQDSPQDHVCGARERCSFRHLFFFSFFIICDQGDRNELNLCCLASWHLFCAQQHTIPTRKGFVLLEAWRECLWCCSKSALLLRVKQTLSQSCKRSSGRCAILS